MAAARERLTDTSEKLRLAFVCLRTVDEEVVSRLTGVGTIPLSQATARVYQAASVAKTAVRSLWKAAEAAEAAAVTTAAAAVSADHAATAAAAAKSAEATAAVGAKAGATAAAAAAAASGLEVKPPVASDRTIRSGDNKGSNDSGSLSSAGLEPEIGNFVVAVKRSESDMSEDEEEDQCTPHGPDDTGEEHESLHDGVVVSEATLEIGGGEEHGEEGGKEQQQQQQQQQQHKEDAREEEEEEKQEEEQNEEKARRGKRKIGNTAEPPGRNSVRASGSQQPKYAESSTMESSKGQRKASMPGTSIQRGGSGAAAAHEKPSTHTTARRHGQGKRFCQEAYCEARAYYGNTQGKVLEFCSKHSKPGMVNLIRKRCGHPGCIKLPSYGTAGSKTREFCSTHSKQGMVDVASRRCGHPGCIKQPSYGTAGSKKAEFCVNHSKPGMVDVASKRCGHPGCMKSPSYGTAGSKTREFCSRHSKQGMVGVASRRCGHPGCIKHPSHGAAGSKAREFCSTHFKPGMVHIYYVKRQG